MMIQMSRVWENKISVKWVMITIIRRENKIGEDSVSLGAFESPIHPFVI